MKESDYPAFEEQMRDLFAAYNRPVEDRVVRVFWERLKDISFGMFRARACSHMEFKPDKFPTPGHLRPKDGSSEQAAMMDTGPIMQTLLIEYVKKYKKLSHRQTSAPWTFVFAPRQWVDGKGDSRVGHSECTGVRIAADGEWPSVNVTASDVMTMQEAP